jgi:hypothetical protein
MHEQGLLPMPGVEHISQPYAFEFAAGLSPDEFGLKTARELEETILRVGPGRVAAFIGEPVQGAGGVIIPPDSYWPEIQRICDRYGILLVSDEVICGFGRTGQWFGCEHYGTRPDLMSMAKALSSGYLPIGGVMVGERVAKTLIAKGGEFGHGFTYSAHPVCAARWRWRTCRSSSANAWSSTCVTPPGPTCSSAGPGWRRIRWWARPVAWACWARWSWSRRRSPVPGSTPAARSVNAAATMPSPMAW